MNQYEIVSLVKECDAAPIEVVLEHTYLQTPESVHGKAALCATEDALRVHMELCCSEIRAVEEGPLGMPCQDSCMEFFFCPDSCSDRYFNFEWNMNGCLYLGFRTDRENAVRLHLKDHKKVFNFRSALTDDGWEIFYEIPISFVRLFVPDFSLSSGKEFRANCYKCGDLTINPHYLSWNQVTSATPDFHRPSDFGQLILE